MSKSNRIMIELPDSLNDALDQSGSKNARDDERRIDYDIRQVEVPGGIKGGSFSTSEILGQLLADHYEDHNELIEAAVEKAEQQAKEIKKAIK